MLDISFFATILSLFIAVLTYIIISYFRQPYSVHVSRSDMVSQKVYDLCQSNVTVSSELAQDPNLAPGKVIKKLYGEDIGGHDEHKHFKPPHATPEDLEKAYQCGKWGSTRPSDLFLRVSRATPQQKPPAFGGREPLALTVMPIT